MSLRDLALAALADKEIAEADLRDMERGALVDAAAALVEQTLVTYDGKFPVKGRDLTIEHVSMRDQLVVLADGDVALAVRNGQVRYVVFDGGWARRSEPITSLADLGRVLSGGRR